MSRTRAVAGLLLVMAWVGSASAQRPKPVLQRKNIQIVPVEHMRLDLSGKPMPFAAHQLLYHGIAYGVQFDKPALPADDGRADADPSRLATTYYHRHSPVGMALARFDWFPGRLNTYSADARLPAALVGGVGGAGPHALANLLVGMWSEPPLGVVGLHMGTLASYARPLQTMHFFEHNPDFIELNFAGAKEKRYFHYVPDALGRGAAVKAFDGDSRALLEKAPDRFYHVLIVEAIKEGADQKLRENLLTREGLKLCMSKVTPGGLVCFHTSCRYYKLDELLAATAESAGYAAIVGRDGYVSERYDGAYTSEWVVIAADRADLKHLKPPPNYAELARKQGNAEAYWHKAANSKVVWTDDNIDYRGLYRGDPHLVPSLRNMLNGMLDYLPVKSRRPGSLLYEAVEGYLRTLDEARVRQLNREGKK